MKKKIISLFITLILIVTSVLPVCASASDDINKILQKIESIPSTERYSYIVIMSPMFMVDSGIDNIIGFINNYSEENNNGSFIDKYIGKLLNYTDKKTLINLLECIKCTDLTARQNLITVIRNKTSIEISENAKKGVETLFNSAYERFPSLDKILSEDGYTTNVLANILNCAVKINGDNPFYVYDTENNEFIKGSIDSELQEKTDNVWKDDNPLFDLTEILSMSVEKLNNFVKPENRFIVASGLSEIGVVKMSSDSMTGDKTEYIPDINIKVEVEENGEKLLTYETSMKRPTLYKINGEELLVIKYAIVENGKITAKLTESGDYVIKETKDKFTDCDGWAKEYIEILAARNIINGKEEGKYMPDDNIKREEFVKLVIELLDIDQNKDLSIFNDVNNESWYAGYVNAAYDNKIINGISETEFGVGLNIKRQDMAKIINTVLMSKGIKAEIKENDFKDFEQIADYAKEHVLSIYSMGIISGDDNKNFNPDQYATRAEAAKMIYGMLTQMVKN